MKKNKYIFFFSLFFSKMEINTSNWEIKIYNNPKTKIFHLITRNKQKGKFLMILKDFLKKI